ncbi:MAG: hypothetical protein A2Y77_07190 [Planctomycetes bacterium RBG_13_62_9]|nr:MAG: hypothetical protein A2Y77_07190 [Planctomycetes bacterium RBG_13_62_9]
MLADWLAENEPAFDMLAKGAATANYWPVYDVNENAQSLGNAQFAWMEANVVRQTMETLARYKQVARALRDRIDYRVRQGEADEAMADALVALRFGCHLEGKGLLIDQLVGIAIEALGNGAVFDVLEKGNVSIEVLSRVQEELASSFREDRRIIDLDGEKAFWYDKLQRTFTDDGHGGGRALRHGLLFAAGDWLSNLAGILLFDYPDRREAVAMVDDHFERARQAIRTPPNKSRLSAEQDEGAGTPASNLLLAVAAPAHERVRQLAWRLRTGEKALLVTIAILRYKAQTDSYPAHLEELVEANLLARVPDDPFGEGPLSYKRTADGFLLYSWGENGKDYGGQRGVNNVGQPREYADNGDWVFWPPSMRLS